MSLQGKMFVLCGKQCAEDFRRMSLLPSRCDYCKVDKGVKEVKRVCGVDRLFCSEGEAPVRLSWSHTLTTSHTLLTHTHLPLTTSHTLLTHTHTYL